MLHSLEGFNDSSKLSSSDGTDNGVHNSICNSISLGTLDGLDDSNTLKTLKMAYYLETQIVCMIAHLMVKTMAQSLVLLIALERVRMTACLEHVIVYLIVYHLAERIVQMIV